MSEPHKIKSRRARPVRRCNGIEGLGPSYVHGKRVEKSQPAVRMRYEGRRCAGCSTFPCGSRRYLKAVMRAIALGSTGSGAYTCNEKVESSEASEDVVVLDLRMPFVADEGMMKEEEEEREMTLLRSGLRLLLAVKADAYLNKRERERDGDE